MERKAPADPLHRSRPSSPSPPPRHRVKKREEHKIIVVGLPSGATSLELTKLVKPYGNPLQCNVVVDAFGKERGFGFVQFGDEAACHAAIHALDKSVFGTRTLNVRMVEERTPPPIKSSGGKARPCFDFSKGKCTRGAACKWAHLAPPQEAAGASRRPEWQKTRPAGTGLQVIGEVPEGICRKYQLGSCHRGAACKWKHEIYSAGGGDEPAAKRAREGEARAAPKELRAGAWAAGAATGVDKRLKPAEGSAVTATPAELRDQLARREAAWRKDHPEHPETAPVPDEVKNRDVVWKALERKLNRLEC
ncbi:hypothetical protein AB1Y20_007642 [Prymnesium parvum]|uniref:Cleavage and polyadenylation specificity factor subunit 4 n=1 Tax=Prymnesium parvum TaxID=97485 RepID=A0AB34IVG7_PRYPA